MGISLFFYLNQSKGFQRDVTRVEILNFAIRDCTDYDFNEEIFSIKFFNRTIVSIFVLIQYQIRNE